MFLFASFVVSIKFNLVEGNSIKFGHVLFSRIVLNKTKQHSFEDKFLIMFNSEVCKNFFSA